MAVRPGAIVRTNQCSRTLVSGASLAAFLGLVISSPAPAYIGDSFISIPGVAGHWPGAEHRNWIRADANLWSSNVSTYGGTGGFGGGRGNGPSGARPGSPGKLTVMVSRDSPDLGLLGDRCAAKAPIPELIFSEASGNGRPPEGAPNYWRYKLKDVEIVECPALQGAAAQAFVLSFKDVEWLNHDPKQPAAATASEASMPDVRLSEPTAKKKVKAFLITWVAIATDATEDQCPAMNSKPTEADVFRYLSQEQVEAIRAKNGEKGVTAGPETEMRGPNRLNAVLLPGIVPDPGLHEPQSPIALGIDLDGDDGSGSPPPGIRKHRNYVSPDGRTGIDNQLYRVMGCIPGFRGKKGYRNQTDNARRADGNITTLVEISGVDDEQNDDNVEVALIHSMDKPIRDNLGSKFIANYTFRPTNDPAFARYNVRVRGRIVNGVVTTDVIPKYGFNSGQGPVYDLVHARMRFEPRPDGSMKGYLAGYQDWRYLATNRASGYSEGLFNYHMPALYSALKRHADGLQDPVTGEFNGISTVYEIDTVPAFLTPAPPKALEVAQRR